MSDLNAFLDEGSGDEPALQEDTTPPGSEPEQQTAADSQPPVNENEGGEQEQQPDLEQPPEGLDKRGEAIWREERTKRKELQSQVDKMNERWMDLVGRMQQQQPQPQGQQQPPSQPPVNEIEIPDFEEDPIGHLRAKNDLLERQLADVNMDRVQRQQATQQLGQFQQLQQGVSQMEAEFAKVTPDYNEAVGFMYEHAAKMAQAMGYAPQQIQQHLSQLAMDISVRALQQGKNPAQAAYEAAKQLGYSGQRAANGEQTPAPRAPSSLSSVAGKRSSPAGVPSLDAIAKMDDASFDKLWAEMERSAQGH